MFIMHVFLHVKPEAIDVFKSACIENASNSLKEAGIKRFDLIQQVEDPTQFVLVEVYNSKNDVAFHKETEHYKLWQKTVEPLMIEPRTRIFYQNIYPEDEGWK